VKLVTYTKLKSTTLDGLDLTMNEHRLAGQDQLSHRCLCEGLKNVNELARDLEKLLSQVLLEHERDGIALHSGFSIKSLPTICHHHHGMRAPTYMHPEQQY